MPRGFSFLNKVMGYLQKDKTQNQNTTRKKQFNENRYAVKSSSIKNNQESPMDVIRPSRMDVIRPSPMDVIRPSQIQMDISNSIEDNNDLPSDSIIPLPKNKTVKLIRGIKKSKSINTITQDIDTITDIAKCNSILSENPSDNTLLNTLINERNSTSCFMQVIYGDDSINRHISEIKSKIIQHNTEESGFMVIYGGTSWNQNFSEGTLNKLDSRINTDGKVDKALRNVSFLKKNYDILVATSDKSKKQNLIVFFTKYLQTLKFKINILFDRHNIRCNCTLEIDNGTSGIGTILNDKKCVKFRLLLNIFIDSESRDFPKTDDALYELLNEDEKQYVSTYSKPSSRRVKIKNKTTVRVNSWCNNELAFYIELGYDSNIDTAAFKRLLINKEYLNERGCFIIQSFLNTDRRDKGINIDEIRRFYCIGSIITGKNKQLEYYDKILTPFQSIFEKNADIIEKLYLYGFKMFNATVSQTINNTTKRGDFNTFLDEFNTYLLESRDLRFLSTTKISIREYSNLLFIEINKYLIKNNYGLLAKAGGECMRYYIKDEKNEIKTKDFDCKLFITNSRDFIKNTELIKKKILILIVFTSLYFNKLQKFKTVTNTYTINFADKQYTITLYPDKQSSLFSSRTLYDFNVPLFSLDLRILYTIVSTPITKKTKKNIKKHPPQRNITGKKRTIKEVTPSSKKNNSNDTGVNLDDIGVDLDDTGVDLDDIVVDVNEKHKKQKLSGGGKKHIIKNYFIETPIDIAITPDKINKTDIANILVERTNLPPILTLNYLKTDVEHTLNHPKSYLNRLFAGKLKKDKARLKKLQESHADVNLNNTQEYINALDKLPDENSSLRLSSIFHTLLNCNIDNEGNYNIDTTTIVNDEDKDLIEISAKLSKNAQRLLDKNKRFKTPFSLELLTQLIHNNDENELEEKNDEEEEEEDYAI